ncbi:(GlcNAc)2 ABC transporter periplasmic substrate-binding protein [Photobacterium aphoticum]|uniref:(GlcNAc)2 ABC transporter periplasmic substrate-binding protein n=1 Tax=Photobacterium aphoticum TaxID=754436 RepID=A0A090RAX7_9GAMM|nr:(GlcNAc)2 ABC transporter periplasmic substrate-binding protein [Photobacterium aphoticum]
MKKITLLAAMVGMSITGMAQATTDVDKMSQVTIIPNHNPTLVRNFNPYLPGRLHTARDFIYEQLVIFNELKGNTPEFRLATDYHFSDDLKSITFEIRDGVKWSDGKPFSAKDVAFTFNNLKKTPALDDRGVNKLIDKVIADGDKVTFHLTEINTNAAYEISLIPVVPEHVWAKIKDPTTFVNENPVGTGPFTEVPRFTPSLFLQCRNPHYWDNDNLEVDCLRVPQYNHNDQVLAALVNSEVDWGGSFVPDIESTFLKASKHHGYWYTAAGTQSFMFNFDNSDPVKREALNNVDFRRAFSMALDRQTVIDVANYGNGTLNDFASGLGYAFEAWSDEKVHNQFRPYMTYNPKEAKALLKKAGFVDRDGDGFVETPSGKQLTLDIQSPGGWTDFNNVVILSAEQLEEVGIRVQVRTPDFAVYNTNMQKAGYDIAFTNYFHGPTPHKYWSSGYHSKLQKGESMPRFAMHFWSDPKLDQLLDDFYKTDKRDKQMEIAHQIQRMIAENQVTVPVISGSNFYQYNTQRFTGWWTKDNAKGRPMPWEGTPERLLHVLDLKPVKS